MSCQIVRTVLKAIGTNQPWKWRLTVWETIKMTLIRPLHDQLQEGREGWLLSATLPPPVHPEALLYKLLPLIVRGSWVLDMSPPSLPVTGFQIKNQPCLLSIGFWAMSSWTLFLIIEWGLWEQLDFTYLEYFSFLLNRSTLQSHIGEWEAGLWIWSRGVICHDEWLDLSGV